MRITILSPPLNLSGGHRVKAIYADRLSRRGHDVLVVAPPERRPLLREKVASLARGRGWPGAPEGTSAHFDGLGVDRRILDAHRPIVDDDVPDADVVVATWWETAEWAAALSPRKGAKVYFVQHHEAFPYLPVDRVEATWRLPMRKIAVSQWLVDVARDRYGDDGAVLVPNSVDPSQFHAPPRGKNAAPTIGLMYAMASFKGCDVCLEAIAMAARRDPGLRVVSFGDAPAAHLPLPAGADHVVRPAQGRIREVYARCDAWLFGSRSEGFGLPILEAMACRTPVIGTPAGAAPELLAQGGGILVAPEDPGDMARAIREVVDMGAARWSRMSDLAFATATRYTWDDATDRFEAALLSAVEGPRRLQPR